MVLRRRDDIFLKQLSAKLRLPPPRTDVQLILTRDVQYDPHEIIGALAAKLKIDIDQVELIGAARGSLRLLVSLPQDAADALVNSRIHDLVNGRYHVISIATFDSLDTASQQAWRRIVNKGSEQPIPWNSVLETNSGDSLSERLLQNSTKKKTRIYERIHNLLVQVVEFIKPPLVKLLIVIVGAVLVVLAFLGRDSIALYFIPMFALLALLALLAFASDVSEKRYRHLERTERALKKALRDLVQDKMLMVQSLQKDNQKTYDATEGQSKKSA